MLKRLYKILNWGSLAAAGLILVGVAVWSVTMVKSGWIYPFGMGFWGANGHDGVWHLAVINALLSGSWEMPVFAGGVLKNYHVGFDLLVAGLVRLSGISAVSWYFQILPPVMAAAIGYLAYRLVYLWRGSRGAAVGAVFFVFFGGGWGWLVSWVREGVWGGESMFWAQGAISTLINPPFALSLVLMLLGLVGVVGLQKRFKLWMWLGVVLCFGVLVEVKVYAGVLGLVGLGGILGWELLVKKRWDGRLASVFAGALGISAVLYWWFFRGSQGLLVWQPGWFLETMMGPDRLNWPKFFEAMTTYRMAGVWGKEMVAYGLAFVIFVLGNVGTRIWGVKSVFGRGKKWGLIEVFMGVVIILGIVLPMVWVQKGTAWNTIQFFYYSLFFLGIGAGVFIGEWMERKRRLAIIGGGLLVFLTLPTTIGALSNYLPSRPPAKITIEELAALEVLAKLPRGVVLTYPFDREAAGRAVANPPRPVYLYESTAYVSAFSNKPVYLEDEVNLDITGYDWQARREAVVNFFDAKDKSAARQFLDNNGVKYLYLVGDQNLGLGEDDLGLQKVFENKAAKIYQREVGLKQAFLGLVRKD